MNQIINPSKIIYTKRKSIALIINNSGDFIVRAPSSVSIDKVNKFIYDKQAWVKRKIDEINQSKLTPIKCIDGEFLSILGNNYEIKLFDDKHIKINNNYIFIPNNNSIKYLREYLIKLAKEYLSARTDKLSHIYGMSYKSITITSAKTRWGSCSYNNKLNFSFRLMLCNKSVIDYIIIHELTHTIFKNHSKTFWRKVRQFMPEYKTCENWLKQNRSIMNLI